jgi:hypothetical protein
VKRKSPEVDPKGSLQGFFCFTVPGAGERSNFEVEDFDKMLEVIEMIKAECNGRLLFEFFVSLNTVYCHVKSR